MPEASAISAARLPGTDQIEVAVVGDAGPPQRLTIGRAAARTLILLLTEAVEDIERGRT